MTTKQLQLSMPCEMLIIRRLGYLLTRVAALQWRHNGYDNVPNHRRHDCLLNRLFRRRSKKTSKLHATGLCAGNSPGTGEFPASMGSNAENVSIWWHHHGDQDKQTSLFSVVHSWHESIQRSRLIFVLDQMTMPANVSIYSSPIVCIEIVGVYGKICLSSHPVKVEFKSLQHAVFKLSTRDHR